MKGNSQDLVCIPAFPQRIDITGMGVSAFSISHNITEGRSRMSAWPLGQSEFWQVQGAHAEGLQLKMEELDAEL